MPARGRAWHQPALGRENPFLNQGGPLSDTVREVDAEGLDGGPAGRRAADQNRPLPAEVSTPLLASGVEERGYLAGLRVDAGQVRALIAVVQEAGEGQILGMGRAFVAFRNHMVDF